MVIQMDIQIKSTIDVSLVQDSVKPDTMVVAAAKVSTNGVDALQYVNGDDNFGLINYLMKHRHGTPFEHNSFTFFVHAPIFVWREWHRHRIGFSYNEESGRYKKLEPIFYLPDKHRKLIKVKEFKPGRPMFEPTNPLGLLEDFRKRFFLGFMRQYEDYEWALSQSIDNGLSRIGLPVALYSGCWVTCNLRSIMAFLSLRTHDPDATFVSYPLQEIEFAARSVEEIFAEIAPLTYKSFVQNGRVGP